MKQIVRNLIVAATCLLSLTSSAESCLLTVQEYIPEAGCSLDLEELPEFDSADWRSCFNAAQKLAMEVGFEGPRKLIALDKFMCKRSFTGYTVPKRTMAWQFNDSFIPMMSSHGTVNSETSKFLKTPLKGEQALDPNGRPLF